jgi:hypothetical protein
VDVCLVIRQRLEELGLEQRDLADAAGSYGLLRFPAPHPEETASRAGSFLKLPVGKLSWLAGHQRKQELKRRLADPPAPLLKEVRELIL